MNFIKFLALVNKHFSFKNNSNISIVTHTIQTMQQKPILNHSY